MKTFIFFENEKKFSPIFFVREYKKKRWFRPEKISYTLSPENGLVFEDEELIDLVSKRICKDFSNARIHKVNKPVFHEKYKEHVFWVIGDFDEGKSNDCASFYSGESRKEVFWTQNLEDAEVYMDLDCANQTADNIRRKVGTEKKVSVKPIYLNLCNGLLTPIMMITCTSKGGKQETKYFSKIDKEGYRLRLVRTSDAARKFTYRGAIQMFDFLKSRNKNFLYAILPTFSDNVKCDDIESYMKENQVSRMVSVTLKLKNFNK